LSTHLAATAATVAATTHPIPVIAQIEAAADVVETRASHRWSDLLKLMQYIGPRVQLPHQLEESMVLTCGTVVAVAWVVWPLVCHLGLRSSTA
jgi:hypothetical protein